MNRKIFFESVRSTLFSGSLSASQVAGMDAILDEWERRKLTFIPYLAFVLATDYHETGATMQPVIETRQRSEDTNPSVDTAIARLERAWKSGKMPWVKSAYWRKDADGLSWLGRGLPQLTHKANYQKAEQKTGIPFTRNPELMLDMNNAVRVMFDGMLDGWFTGKELADYRDGDKFDYVNARRIINGTDKAAAIAGHARKFEAALLLAKAASVDNNAPSVSPVIDKPVPTPAPVPAPEVLKPTPINDPAPPVKKSWWSLVAGLFAFIFSKNHGA